MKINHYDKIKGKTVLITGGLGFIGHNLAKTLLEHYNCKIILVDDCSNSDEKILNQFSGNFEFHKISVNDNDKLFPLFDNVNIIFHLACKQISISGSDPQGHLKVNAESTLEMLEYIRHHNLSKLERFVYTSSCSIYGSSTHLPSDEDSKKNILSNYAATKLLGENFSLVYFKNYDIPVSVVRYSNVYGFGQSPRNPYCGVLGKFIHNALLGEDLTIFGDGEQTRDYTFITDAIDATILAAVHPASIGDVFNIGTCVETSVNKLVEIISEVIPGTNVKSIPERDIDNVRRRLIDIEKIHQRLGWTPRINIKKGIEKTIEWYKSTL